MIKITFSQLYFSYFLGLEPLDTMTFSTDSEHPENKL